MSPGLLINYMNTVINESPLTTSAFAFSSYLPSIPREYASVSRLEDGKVSFKCCILGANAFSP